MPKVNIKTTNISKNVAAKNVLSKNDPDTNTDVIAQNAIIIDIDGTIALKSDRSPYEWHRVGEDTLYEAVYNLLHYMDKNIIRIFVSGRDAVCRPETEKWLKDHNIHYDFLYMRPKYDMRKDVIIKKEIYEAHIKGKYNILFVLDDRDQVVKLWRSLGLSCFQVAEGNF